MWEGLQTIFMVRGYVTHLDHPDYLEKVFKLYKTS